MSRVDALHLAEARTLKELQALAPDWERLASAVEPALPFNLPSWHRRWFESFAQKRLSIRDRLCVFSLRRPDGELIAVAPMMITERPSIGPLRLRMMQFTGADPNITELRTVICRPEHEAVVYRALLSALRERRERWDLLVWTGLRADSEAQRLVYDEKGAHPGPELPDYLLDLPATYPEFRAGLSRNMKEALRKCRNAPARDGLVFTNAIATTPAEVEEALSEFFVLHRARAHAEGTVHHNDAFATQLARDFLRGVAAELSCAGKIRIYQLRHGDKVIACRIAFALEKTLYLYYSGYDLDYSKYSAMTRCVAVALRDACEQGFKSVNLSVGADLSKTRWGPRRVIYREAILISQTARGQIAGRVRPALLSVRENPKLRETLLVRAFSRTGSKR